MDINLLSAIIFYILIFLLIVIYKKKFEVHGIAFLYKTKIGLKLMDRIANSCPRLLKFLSTLGIYICFLGMIFIFLFLLKGIYNLFFSPESGPVMSLVIPGIKIPGFIYIPFWYGIIAIFVVIVIHEFSHGVISRLHKVKVTSSGVGMFAIIPLAFVEPDQKELDKKSRKQQLSVFAAGPFSNILTSIIVALLLAFVIAPWADSILHFDGIGIDDVVADGPAEKAGLQAGDLIISIDDIEVNVTNFNELLSSKSPGDTVVFKTEEKEIPITTLKQKDDGLQPYYGIYYYSKVSLEESVVAKFGDKLPYLIIHLLKLMNWIFILSLGIGLANLPLGPVDGGRIMLTSLTKFFKSDRAVNIWKYISFFVLLLLLLNIAFPLLKKFIHPSL